MLQLKPSIDSIQIRGRKLTRQRRQVLEILEVSREHLDAEAIHDQVKAHGAKVSLATVYRTLTLLKETGLVQEDRLGEDHGHFETTQPTPHYHFSCTKCGRVVEFEALRVLEEARKLCENQGLQVTDIHLHFSGICGECRKGDTNCEQNEKGAFIS